MGQLIRDTDNAVTLHTAASSLAAPSGGGDGADLTAIQRGPASSQFYLVTIDGSTTLNLTVAWLDVYDGSAWRRAVNLNGGAQIDLTATLGYQEIVEVADPERAAVEGTLSAGNVTIVITPLELS